MTKQDIGEHNKAIRKEYIEGQLLQAQPVPLKPDEFVRIQIHGNFGKTNWLNITSQQLSKIEEILLDF